MAKNEFLGLRCAKATYDFAVHTGDVAAAVGLGVIIPNGAVIKSVVGNVITTLASSGSATLAINLGATEVNAATAFDSADYVSVDSHFSTLTVLSADSEVNVDIAGAALTAGKYDIYVEYYV